MSMHFTPTVFKSTKLRVKNLLYVGLVHWDITSLMGIAPINEGDCRVRKENWSEQYMEVKWIWNKDRGKVWEAAKLPICGEKPNELNKRVLNMSTIFIIGMLALVKANSSGNSMVYWRESCVWETEHMLYSTSTLYITVKLLVKRKSAKSGQVFVEKSNSRKHSE